MLNASSKTKKRFYKISIVAVIISCLSGFFWASAPLFGWSEYSFEGAMISCSIEWNKKTPSVMSYNIAITVFVYIIPLLLLFYTNARMLIMVITVFNNC